ncbi:hypothetical protein [Krasilnikovia sp. MM14-A1259]|uniref:hypothetical protein n=1 Tax=Krasilnikovia sp. MM14-A1259 TaxID=3373539 RepID=UPI00399D434C
MTRRVLLAVIGCSTVALLPWTWYLAVSLPSQHHADQWRVAWVGFDLGLVGCFAAASWLGWRRHRTAVPVLAATAALLCCDAWFDILLDWTAPDRWLSILTAILAELPLAVVLLIRARDLLVGGMPSRPLTADDIAIHQDGRHQALLGHLSEHGPAGVHALAVALDRRPDDVAGALSLLAHAGFVGCDRRGRWSAKPLSLRTPKADESWVRPYLDQKYENEVRVLANAARNHAKMGRWGKREAAAIQLTSAELTRFNAEYLELLNRYCLLRDRPVEGTRTVLVRFYAFPREFAEPVAAGAMPSD